MNEFIASNVPTGSTVYAVRVRQSDGQWWNGSTYESYNAANWTTYDIAMSEVGALGIFKADDPDSATAGYAHYYKQTGGSPAATDTYLGGEGIAQTSGSGATAADVWTYGTRTLSTSGIDSIVAALGGYEITLASPVTEDEDLELVQGDDYTHSTRQPTWTVTSYTGPSLTAATATLSLCDSASYDLETDSVLLACNGTITVNSGTVTVKVPIGSTQTASLPTYPSDDPYHLKYQLRTTDGTNVQTLALGAATVKRKVAT